AAFVSENMMFSKSHWGFFLSRVNVTNINSRGSMDAVQGSFNDNAIPDMRKKIDENSKISTKSWFVYNEKFCFIPTISALGFKQPVANWHTPVNDRNLLCNNEINFDSYYLPPTNEKHIFLTEANVNWVMQEIEKGQPGCPTICTFSITGGSNTLCINSPEAFSLDVPAPPNTTVQWILSPNLQMISSNSNSVTVKAISPGGASIKAIISNPCGANMEIVKTQLTAGTPMVTINGQNCPSESAPCSLNATPVNNYLQFTLSAALGSYIPTDADWQWEKVSGNFFFLDNGAYTGTSHTGNQADIYLTGANPTDNPLKLRCRVKNDCGWGAWRYAEWNDGTTSPPPPAPEKYYKVAPNPTGGYDAKISLLNSSIIPATTSPITVRLYTIFGTLLSTTQMYNNSSGTVYIYSYPYNTMYITISFDNHLESHTINKY
ncbi:MAG: hypothetical protein GXC73_19895, partial [Chitinophagaceae bacterium]|nr:hypothetical protein [Chitinophagaceae bacterium]